MRARVGFVPGGWGWGGKGVIRNCESKSECLSKYARTDSFIEIAKQAN